MNSFEKYFLNLNITEIPKCTLPTGTTMTLYEKSSLILTGIYDLLTFGLLFFVAFEAIVKPKIPKLSLSLQQVPDDTDSASWRAALLDLVIENRGNELKNLTIKSIPDELNWGKHNKATEGKKTSEHFHSAIPFIREGERLTFFWCEAETNKDVIEKPITIIIEFDNPFMYPKRKTASLKLDFSVYKGIYWGVNNKYDIHNVVKELTRLRKEFNDFSRICTDLLKKRRNEG